MQVQSLSSSSLFDLEVISLDKRGQSQMQETLWNAHVFQLNILP